MPRKIPLTGAKERADKSAHEESAEIAAAAGAGADESSMGVPARAARAPVSPFKFSHLIKNYFLAELETLADHGLNTDYLPPKIISFSEVSADDSRFRLAEFAETLANAIFDLDIRSSMDPALKSSILQGVDSALREDPSLYEFVDTSLAMIKIAKDGVASHDLRNMLIVGQVLRAVVTEAKSNLNGGSLSTSPVLLRSLSGEDSRDEFTAFSRFYRAAFRMQYFEDAEVLVAKAIFASYPKLSSFVAIVNKIPRSLHAFASAFRISVDALRLDIRNPEESLLLDSVSDCTVRRQLKDNLSPQKVTPHGAQTHLPLASLRQQSVLSRSTSADASPVSDKATLGSCASSSAGEGAGSGGDIDVAAAALQEAFPIPDFDAPSVPPEAELRRAVSTSSWSTSDTEELSGQVFSGNRPRSHAVSSPDAVAREIAIIDSLNAESAALAETGRELLREALGIRKERGAIPRCRVVTSPITIPHDRAPEAEDASSLAVAADSSSSRSSLLSFRDLSLMPAELARATDGVRRVGFRIPAAIIEPSGRVARVLHGRGRMCASHDPESVRKPLPGIESALGGLESALGQSSAADTFKPHRRGHGPV